MFLVSRCCVGVPCRYRGNGTTKKRILKLAEKENFVTCCPEVDGGMSTPREGCAVIDGQVLGRKTGDNYTAAYVSGAHQALLTCRALGIKRAYLLAGSPSCGRGYGLTAKLLESNGIRVIKA